MWVECWLADLSTCHLHIKRVQAISMQFFYEYDGNFCKGKDMQPQKSLGRYNWMKVILTLLGEWRPDLCSTYYVLLDQHESVHRDVTSKEINNLEVKERFYQNYWLHCTLVCYILSRTNLIFHFINMWSRYADLKWKFLIGNLFPIQINMYITEKQTHCF